MMNIKTMPVLLLVLTLPIAVSGQEDDYRTADELGLMKGFPPPPELRVDKSNALLFAPYNRWSYQNMRRFYPSAPIRNADRVVPLAYRIDGAIERLSVEGPGDRGAVGMETYLEETYTDALVVIHGDRIVYERFLNGMHALQPHQMMSVTKSFGGLLGLLAVEDGKVSESDSVADHVPELAESGAFGDATFGHVLDMTNSMAFTEVYADPDSGIRHYGVVLGLMEPDPAKTYAGSIYEYLPTLDEDPAHEHGAVFHYQTPKTDVVNWVTNRVTRQSFEDALYEKLWSQLGTEGENYVLLDANGTLFAGGGLNATPHDLARFASMMVSGGRFDGRQIIEPNVIETLARGGDREAFARGPDAKGFMDDGNWSYRAQWWVRHTPGKEAFTAIGIHGQYIYCDVERGVAIVKQSSQPVSADDFFDTYNYNAFDAIIAHVSAR